MTARKIQLQVERDFREKLENDLKLLERDLAFVCGGIEIMKSRVIPDLKKDVEVAEDEKRIADEELDEARDDAAVAIFIAGIVQLALFAALISGNPIAIIAASIAFAAALLAVAQAIFDSRNARVEAEYRDGVLERTKKNLKTAKKDLKELKKQKRAFKDEVAALKTILKNERPLHEIDSELHDVCEKIKEIEDEIEETKQIISDLVVSQIRFAW